MKTTKSYWKPSWTWLISWGLIDVRSMIDLLVIDDCFLFWTWRMLLKSEKIPLSWIFRSILTALFPVQSAISSSKSWVLDANFATPTSHSSQLYNNHSTRFHNPWRDPNLCLKYDFRMLEETPEKNWYNTWTTPILCLEHYFLILEQTPFFVWNMPSESVMKRSLLVEYKWNIMFSPI